MYIYIYIYSCAYVLLTYINASTCIPHGAQVALGSPWILRRTGWLTSKSSRVEYDQLKPCENHRKTRGKWWFNGILWDLPYGNLLHSY